MSDEAPDTIDVSEYVEPLRRYRPLIVTFVLAATVSSLGFTYAVSERYQASTTILYQPRENVSFRPKARDALGFPPPLVPLESIGNTLQEVLQSDAIISKTVELLRLDVKETPPASNLLIATLRETKDTIKEWRQNAIEILKHGRVLPKDPFTQAMLTLQRNVRIKRTAKAYTFELEVTHENARRAAQIVDTLGPLLAKFLAAEHARAARESREKIFPRLQSSSEEVAALREQLEAAKISAGVASLSQELSLKLESVNRLERQLADATNDLRATVRRRAELIAQLAGQNPDIRFESTMTQNPIVDEMKLVIARLEVERSGLLEELTPAHHQVKAIDAKLEQARAKMQREVARLVSSESTRVNELHRKLLADKLTADVEVEALRARERALESLIAEHEADTRRLTEQEPQLAELTLQLKSAEDAYALIHESYEEARLAEARETSEVSILHAALVPPAPARPIKIVHVGVSFVLSLCLALGLALATHLFDDSVRTIGQAERALAVPVLATIPAIAPKHARYLVPSGLSQSVALPDP